MVAFSSLISRDFWLLLNFSWHLNVFQQMYREVPQQCDRLETKQDPEIFIDWQRTGFHGHTTFFLMLLLLLLSGCAVNDEQMCAGSSPKLGVARRSPVPEDCLDNMHVE